MRHHRMRRPAARAAFVHGWLLGVALGAVLALPAVAAERQRTSKGVVRNAERVMRTTNAQEAPAQASEPSPPPNVAILGLAHEHGPGDDRAWTTPFVLGRTVGDGYVEVSGDGWLRSRADGERVHGWSDFSLLGSWTFTSANGRHGLTPEFEIVVPTAGAAGSGHASQIARLGWRYERGAWAGLLVAGLGRDGQPPEGASSTQHLLKARLQHSWADGRSAFVEVKRRAQRGDAGRSAVHVEFDFPIASTVEQGVRRTWSGAFNVGRGGSPGQRSTSVEFDLVRAF